MGLGTQMIAWDEAFCGELVDRGHHVIRFDNRDIGLSTKLDEHPPPSLLELMPKLMAGEAVDVPYDVTDMADDAIGVLDALGRPSHKRDVVGLCGTQRKCGGDRRPVGPGEKSQSWKRFN